MDGLIRLQNSLFQIRQILAANTEVRKLLIYDSKNCLSGSAPDISLVPQYIFISPVFNTNVEPYNKNTFITLYIDELDYNEDFENHSGFLKVNIFSRTELWEIDNNKIRTLELSSLVIRELNAQKLLSSHKLSYDGLSLVVIDKDFQGYTLIFRMLDGGGLENEF